MEWQVETEPAGDTVFFQQALAEFRRAERIETLFHELPVWAQRRVLARAQILKEGGEITRRILGGGAK